MCVLCYVISQVKLNMVRLHNTLMHANIFTYFFILQGLISQKWKLNRTELS
jgi:hypothetical protein